MRSLKAQEVPVWRSKRDPMRRHHDHEAVRPLKRLESGSLLPDPLLLRDLLGDLLVAPFRYGLLGQETKVYSPSACGNSPELTRLAAQAPQGRALSHLRLRRRRIVKQGVGLQHVISKRVCNAPRVTRQALEQISRRGHCFSPSSTNGRSFARSAATSTGSQSGPQACAATLTASAMVRPSPTAPYRALLNAIAAESVTLAGQPIANSTPPASTSSRAKPSEAQALRTHSNPLLHGAKNLGQLMHAQCSFVREQSMIFED